MSYYGTDQRQAQIEQENRLRDECAKALHASADAYTGSAGMDEFYRNEVKRWLHDRARRYSERPSTPTWLISETRYTDDRQEVHGALAPWRARIAKALGPRESYEAMLTALASLSQTETQEPFSETSINTRLVSTPQAPDDVREAVRQTLDTVNDSNRYKGMWLSGDDIDVLTDALTAALSAIPARPTVSADDVRAEYEKHKVTYEYTFDNYSCTCGWKMARFDSADPERHKFESALRAAGVVAE